MRTTSHLIGAAALLSTIALYGCTGSESGTGIIIDNPGGSAGAGGDDSIQIHVGPAGKDPIEIHVGRGSTGTGQGGSGGSTETAPGGSGGSTETATGGSGGSTQTITITSETTIVGNGTGTEMQTTTATSSGSGTETSTGTVTSPVPTTNGPNGPGPTAAPVDLPAASPEDACPGTVYRLFAGDVLTVAGSTKGMRDDLKTRCGAVSTEGYFPDVVYQVEFKDEVTLDLQLIGMDFMPALSIRQGACQAERYEDLCISTEDIALKAQLAMAPGIYWFVVDSADGRAGNFWFALTTAKPACGDGVVNPRTEECDVGPGRENDGCYDPESPLGCMYGEKSDPAGQAP